MGGRACVRTLDHPFFGDLGKKVEKFPHRAGRSAGWGFSLGLVNNVSGRGRGV